MKLKTFFLSITILLSLYLFGQGDIQRMAIVNATYLDVNTGSLVEGATILIEGEHFSRIGKNIKVPEGTTVFDATGKTIIPGLIDSHIHFFQSAGIYTRPDFIDLTSVKPYEEERQWLLDNFEDLAQRYVKLGITSVIDVGGPMTNYNLRERAKNKAGFPNIYITGPLISTYQPAAFNIEDPPIIKVSTEEEAREEVLKQLPYKPDFIKIWYIHMPSLTAESTYPIIEATIDESHKHGLPVAVHATQLNTAKLAIRAGADFLVHGIDDKPVDEEFINMLNENEVVLSPTLIVIHKYYEAFSTNNELSMLDLNFANPFTVGTLFDVKTLEDHQETINKLSEVLAKRVERDSLLMANLKTMADAGITIATGTDAGNIGTQHASSLFEEMQLMEKAGMSKVDVLRATTIDASKSINIADSLGSIEEGKLADLVILNTNPLEDLDFGLEINYVVKSGQLIKTDTLLPDTPEMLVQRQLNAYNDRNIEAFLEPYADDVELYQFPDKLLAKGLVEMRKSYTEMFDKTTNLHVELRNRVVVGKTVVDHELVTGFGEKKVEAMAIYEIEDGKIAKVYFVR